MLPDYKYSQYLTTQISITLLDGKTMNLANTTFYESCFPTRLSDKNLRFMSSDWSLYHPIHRINHSFCLDKGEDLYSNWSIYATLLSDEENTNVHILR